MNSRVLEERQDRERDERVASALGISVDDLNRIDWSLEDHVSDDGVLYGHNVYFAEGADCKILARIQGLIDNRWIRIGPVI